MAVNFSKKQEEFANKNYYGQLYNQNNLALNKILKIIKQANNKFFNLSNKIKKKFFYAKNDNEITFSLKGINNTITRNQFKDSGYFFIENFLTDECHNYINNYWPNNCFFYAPDSPLKNYNFGFRYLNKQFINNDDFKKNVAIRKFYNFIISKEFEIQINNSIGETGYKVFSIVASFAKEDSFLIPHQDTSKNDSEVRNLINIIYFVDGSEDVENSGATGIYDDPDFKKLIYAPKTIKNAALIYNSKMNFFHGFKKMSFDSYRKAISFQLEKI